jgi:hypothetical protein
MAPNRACVSELIAAATRALLLLEHLERGEGETAVLLRTAIANMEDCRPTLGVRHA